MPAQETKDVGAFTGALETLSRFRGSANPNHDGPEAVSIIGQGLKLVGDLTGRGDIQVEGEVEGTVKSDGSVVVGPTGVVDGKIEASEVVAAGRVSGSVEAKSVVRLKQGCRVDADIQTPAMELEEGGVVNGRVDMGGVARKS